MAWLGCIGLVELRRYSANFSDYPCLVHLVVHIVDTFVNLVIVERNLNQDLLILPVPHSYRRRDLPEDCQLPASDNLINVAAERHWASSLYLLHSLHNVLPICRMRV